MAHHLPTFEMYDEDLKMILIQRMLAMVLRLNPKIIEEEDAFLSTYKRIRKDNLTDHKSPVFEEGDEPLKKRYLSYWLSRRDVPFDVKHIPPVIDKQPLKDKHDSTRKLDSYIKAVMCLTEKRHAQTLKHVFETKEETANCRNNHLNMVPRLMKTCQQVKSESFRDLEYILADGILRQQNVPMSSQQRETDISLQWAMHGIVSEDMDDKTFFTDYIALLRKYSADGLLRQQNVPMSSQQRDTDISLQWTTHEIVSEDTDDKTSFTDYIALLRKYFADNIKRKQMECMLVGERDPVVSFQRAITRIRLRSEDTNDKTSFTDCNTLLWEYTEDTNDKTKDDFALLREQWDNSADAVRLKHNLHMLSRQREAERSLQRMKTWMTLRTEDTNVITSLTDCHALLFENNAHWSHLIQHLTERQIIVIGDFSEDTNDKTKDDFALLREQWDNSELQWSDMTKEAVWDSNYIDARCVQCVSNMTFAIRRQSIYEKILIDQFLEIDIGQFLMGLTHEIPENLYLNGNSDKNILTTYCVNAVDKSERMSDNAFSFGLLSVSTIDFLIDVNDTFTLDQEIEESYPYPKVGLIDISGVTEACIGEDTLHGIKETGLDTKVGPKRIQTPNEKETNDPKTNEPHFKALETIDKPTEADTISFCSDLFTANRKVNRGVIMVCILMFLSCTSAVPVRQQSFRMTIPLAIDKAHTVLFDVKPIECILLSALSLQNDKAAIKFIGEWNTKMMKKVEIEKKYQKYQTSKDEIITKNKYSRKNLPQTEGKYIGEKSDVSNIPPAHDKVKSRHKDVGDNSDETMDSQPFQNIGSCFMDTINFIQRYLGCSSTKREYSQKRQSESSKKRMNCLGFFVVLICVCAFWIHVARTIWESYYSRGENGNSSSEKAVCQYLGSANSALKDENIVVDVVEPKQQFLNFRSSNFQIPEVPVFPAWNENVVLMHQLSHDLDFVEDAERKDEVDTTHGEMSDSDDYFLNQKGRINDGNEKSSKILPPPAELQDIPATLDLQEPFLVNNDNDEKLVADKQINTEFDIFLADTVAEDMVDTTARNGKVFQNDMIENDMAKRKSPRVKHYKRQFVSWQELVDTSLILPFKRKHLSEDVKSNKRTRLQGIVARQSDFDVEVNEALYALSLRRKTHINTNMVYFLLDLIHLPRKWSTKKMIEASCYLVTEDEELKVKEVFLSLECYETEASKPVHKDIDPYFIGSLLGDNSDYEIPGIDYELQFLKSKPRDKESDIPKQNKSGHANCSIEGFTLQVKLKDSFQGEADEENNIATWLQSAIPRSEEEAAVNTEYSRGTSKKVAKVKMQVTPPAFYSQSDVSPLSRSNLQDALTFAEGSEDKEFQNLANKKNASIFFEELKDEFGMGNGDVPSERNKNALLKEIIRNLPQPQIDTSLLKNYVFHTFDPIMVIIDQIANGTPPTPHISMRYELLRFCTLRSYPKENKPFIIKLAEAGFYYASDGDGVVCYCCGIRRYNWVEEDIPMKIHKRVNPNCKFLKKNEEVNVPVQYFGPYRKALMAIMDIPEPVEREDRSEDVNNDWAPERVRSPAASQPNRRSESAANSLGINTATPKHTQYATKTARVGSYSGWPDTASHTPEILADAGFFYAGFGDCVRCFYCGIGLRHWTKEDDPFVEHARWSRNCVFVKQKKGEEFVNLVQMAAQYSQENENETQSSSPAGNQLPAQEVERLLLSDAAQSVLEMGYQPRIIKRAIEQILRQNGNEKITAQTLMERVLEIEEADERAQAASAQSVEGASAQATAKPLTAKPSAAKGEGSKSDKDKANDKDKKSSNDNKDKKEDKTSPPSNGLSSEAASQDPKEIKKENEELKEQTLCKVCLDNTVCIVFLPCGHLVTCADCAPAMRKCPICRAVVKGTVRTYMS